jgi:hypothetical protein
MKHNFIFNRKQNHNQLHPQSFTPSEAIDDKYKTQCKQVEHDNLNKSNNNNNDVNILQKYMSIIEQSRK